MGLLDDLKDKAGDLLGGDKNVGGSIMEMIQGHGGGLSGLVDKFKESGFADTVSSWVGTGENKAISGSAIQQVLGNEKLQALADKLGISMDQVASKVSEYLPQIVDKLTPDGKVPEGGALEKGMSMLKEKFGI